MCGLVGSLTPEAAAAPPTLLTMLAELAHRGPDGVGLYVDGPFGMGSTRLAIVDIEGGDQPMTGEDGRFWAMQNGEIYNHPELRRELEALGHRFSSRCDTETLVHAFEEWGPGCLERLNGDFAIAIWDRVKQEAFVARDRFGVRPLFLLERQGLVCFASEVKALLRHPRAVRELDPVALVETFTMWAISPERSAFQGVRELPPGHYLILGADGTRIEQRWWSLDFEPDTLSIPTFEEAAAQLRELLDDATRIRLRADVPVAAYLSGGLDSSAIVALARHHAQRPLQLFGLGFAEPEFDESAHQTRLARAFDTDVEQVIVTNEVIGELLPRAVALAECPTLRTALVPLLALSGLVHAAGVKVVMSGEGADELFAGYDLFREDKIRRFWARDAASTSRPLLLRRLYPYLSRTLSDSPLGLRFFAHRLDETSDPLYSHLLRFDNTGRCVRLLDPNLFAGAIPDVRQALANRLPVEFASFTPLARAQFLEVTTFLDGYLLHAQGDRMMMGNSVEGRFPYLDHRVAEFAARLPDRYRLQGLQEKRVLRSAMIGLLPDSIRMRGKQPYRAPITATLVGATAPAYVATLLSPESLRRAGLFDSTAVERLATKGRGSIEQPLTETEEMALVGVVSTMLLHEQLVAHPPPARTVVPGRTVIGAQVQPQATSGRVPA